MQRFRAVTDQAQPGEQRTTGLGDDRQFADKAIGLFSQDSRRLSQRGQPHAQRHARRPFRKVKASWSGRPSCSSAGQTRKQVAHGQSDEVRDHLGRREQFEQPIGLVLVVAEGWKATAMGAG